MIRLPPGLLLSLSLAASSFFLPSNAQSTSNSTAGCLRLLGSVACGGCEYIRLSVSDREHTTEGAGEARQVSSPLKLTLSSLSLRSSPVLLNTVEGAFIHPQNLSTAFPWMESVSTVAEFDAAALLYFSDPSQCDYRKRRREREDRSLLTCLKCRMLIRLANSIRKQAGMLECYRSDPSVR